MLMSPYKLAEYVDVLMSGYEKASIKNPAKVLSGGFIG